MTNSMPINPAPIMSVQVEDFSPDYNAAPPTFVGSHFAGDGSFVFVSHVPANFTNYVRVRTNLTSGTWQTIATIVPTTNSFTFTDPAAGNASTAGRHYRRRSLPATTVDGSITAVASNTKRRNDRAA